MIHQAGVYEIVNTVNGKRYIGAASSFYNRWRAHRSDLNLGKHRNAKLQRAWNKYGAEAFQFNKLLVCAVGNILMYEQRCLDGLAPEYNIATCASAPMLGKKFTLEHRAKISAAQIGKTFSPEALANMSKGQMGNKNSLGRIHPPEIRKKMSEIQKGHKQSPEQIEKRAAKLRGQKRTPEQRANQSAGRRAANARRKLEALNSPQENQP